MKEAYAIQVEGMVQDLGREYAIFARNVEQNLPAALLQIPKMGSMNAKLTLQVNSSLFRSLLHSVIPVLIFIQSLVQIVVVAIDFAFGHDLSGWPLAVLIVNMVRCMFTCVACSHINICH